jgi:hypothetical protein
MNRQNRLLLIVLLVLVVVWAAYTYLASWRTSDQEANFMNGVELSRVDRISWGEGDHQQTMIKTDQRWQLQSEQNWKLQPELVEAAMQSLSELASSSLIMVSDRADQKSVFGLDKPVKITLSAGDGELVKLEVGQSDGLRSYVSQAGENRSYLSNVDLSVWRVEEWRNQTIFDSNPELWQSLSLENPRDSRQNWQLKRQGSEWLVVDKAKKISGQTVASRVNVLSRLVATAIPEQKLTESGLDKPTWILRAASASLVNELRVGKLQGDNYYVQAGASEPIYLVDKAVIDLLQGRPESWR